MKRSQCPDTVEFSLHNSNGYVATIGGWAIASIILYVLSMGPVVAVVKYTGVGHDIVPYVYAPLIWAARFPFLKYPLLWYGSLWGWQ